MNTLAASCVQDVHRRPRGIGCPAVAPVEDGDKGRQELATFLTQAVLGASALAGGLVVGSLEQTVVDERGEGCGVARGAAPGIVSQPEEVTPTPLAIEGELPGWLSGSLIRTVPACFEVGGRPIEHWFDGLALLNAFAFAEGGVTYSSRYLQSETLADADSTGRRTRRGFANDPCMSIFGRVLSIFAPTHKSLTDNGNVNIGRIGDQWVALTEAPMPVAFDPASLETLGLIEHADDLALGHGTPHPHYDERGAMVNSFLSFGARPAYHLYETGIEGTGRRELTVVRSRTPAYMHSFAMTERYWILIEQPWVIDPVQIARSGRPLRDIQNVGTGANNA